MKRIAMLALALGILGPSANAGEFPGPTTAPLNPAWEEYIRSSHGRSEDSRFGYIPSPLPVRIHQPGQEALSPAYQPPRGRTDITSPKYDLHDPNGDGDTADNLLTRVQNQGQCGACWTFATYASLESHLKKALALPDVDNDYSENQLKHMNGFYGDPCGGGNFKKAVAYLARLDGPVSEACDPYVEFSETANTCPPVRYVDNAVMLPARSGPTDNAYIKQALLTYGALQTAMWWDDAHYNDSNFTYYYDTAPLQGYYNTNHGVSIVGWDDTKMTAGGTGAFIVKNSWGTGWGENGYFYISYQDARLASDGLGYFMDGDDGAFDFDVIYQYDPLGMTGATGFYSSYAWGANRFVPTSDGQLKAVGIYLPEDNMSFEITVYGTLTGVEDDYHFSSALTNQSGNRLYAGYYTIPLNSPVSVRQNDDVIISVKFDATVADSIFPIPYEGIQYYYSDTASAAPGQSYISHDGVRFIDYYNPSFQPNICVKAFVKNDPLSEIRVTGGNPVMEIPDGDTTPATTDGTEFGLFRLNDPTVERAFTIHNDGTEPLNLIGTPLVAVSGSSFTVSVQPNSATVAAGENVSFTLRFFPTTEGISTATVSIANNDANESLYDFTVRGVVPPPADVTGNGLVSLEDVIAALKVTADIPTSGLFIDADVDGDGAIGLAEAVAALRRVAGL